MPLKLNAVGGWRADADAFRRQLQNELQATPRKQETAQWRKAVQDDLSRADDLLTARYIRRVCAWWGGGQIEAAWSALHRASIGILMVVEPEAVNAQIPAIRAAVRANLPRNDVRRGKAEEDLTQAARALGAPGVGAPAVAERWRVMAARQAAYEASDEAHGRVRKWRNILLATGALLGVGLIALAVIHVFVPAFLSLLPAKSHSRTDAVEVWAVELAGAFGGAIAAVFAIRRFSGFADPYGLPLHQAMSRVPTGSAVSLVGVLIMQTSAFGVLTPQHGTRVLVWAILFGYAPDFVLRLLDHQAGEVLDEARGKNDPKSPAPPAKATDR